MLPCHGHGTLVADVWSDLRQTRFCHGELVINNQMGERLLFCLAILDDQGCPVSGMARGEICICGRTVYGGYFKWPDANEALSGGDGSAQAMKGSMRALTGEGRSSLFLDGSRN